MVERFLSLMLRSKYAQQVAKRAGFVSLQSTEPDYVIEDPEPERPVSKSTQQDYLSLYQSLIWAFRGVHTVASAAASVPHRITRGSPKQRIPYPIHPANKLLDNPNPVYTNYQLLHRSLSFLMILGDAYWFIETKHGLPYRIHVPRPDRVKIKTEGSNISFLDTINEQTWPGKYVVHFFEFNPLSEVQGFGPLMATQASAIVDLYLSTFARDWFERAVYPSQTYRTDKVLSDVAYERFIAKVKRFHQGYRNFHDILLLEGGIEPADTDRSAPADKDYFENKRLTREEVLSALGCYHLVALLQSKSASVLKEAKRMFWEELLPRLTNFEQTVTKDFLFKFYPDAEEKDLQFEFDSRQISGLRDSFLDESLAYYRLWMMGSITPNEVRERLAIPDKVEWGDQAPPSWGLARGSVGRMPKDELSEVESNVSHLERYVDQFVDEVSDRINDNDGSFGFEEKTEIIGLLRKSIYQFLADEYHGDF